LSVKRVLHLNTLFFFCGDHALIRQNLMFFLKLIRDYQTDNI